MLENYLIKDMFHMKLYKDIKQLKIHETLFYLFILLIPIQTRILYQPEHAYISWYFNYSLAIFVYLSDIVLFACFISWILFDKPQFKPIGLSKALLIILSLILISQFHVKQTWLGWYETLKWLELLGLIYYVYKTFIDPYQFKVLACLLVIGGFVQSIIALIQFHVQHMIGLRFLGEYIAPLGTSGLATIETSAGKVIRAYGTMPHPNVLGGFLVLSLVFGLYLVSHETSKRTKILLEAGIVSILVGIFVTFSRSAWAGAALALFSFLVYWAKDKQWPKFISILLVVIVSCATIFTFYSSTLKARVLNDDPVSISDRGFFNSMGLNLVRKNPVLGVGAGEYVPALEKKYDLAAWKYQPAHNIFIFIAAELGVLGLGAFVWILWQIFSKAYAVWREPIGFAIILVGAIFLFMGQFDHYFLTIQQGRLMWFTVLGLIAALPNLHAQKSN
jgi:O-antigen ligase